MHVNRRAIFALVSVFCLFTVSSSAQEKDVAIAVTNAGFETGAEGALPDGWTLVSGAGGTAGISKAVKHTGAAAIRLSAAGAGDSIAVASPTLKLEVGHLYRLGAWIRTEGVSADALKRYPTPLPACVAMYSFPFTNASPAVGGTGEWRPVNVLFIATKSEDRVQLHLGRNGNAVGTAWFDDVTLEKVGDITEYIPLETVRWAGKGYRYDDNGWIFVHIEGEPYERGYQYGLLLADEIVAYLDKLAIRQNENDPERGWGDVRFMTDAILLRGYDDEYLTEMKGIADGVNRAGVKHRGRALDYIDIAGINSSIDLGQMQSALRSTATYLTGRNFLRAEEELLLSNEYNKCSSFVATGSATTDSRPVFGQIFMWNGYTGAHWDVVCDVQPAKGNRIVFHTFPGGIHSGADFYINSAGIVVGETTVAQTPFDITGTPQSNRIRKALQYGNSIDEVAKILFEHNNGMYTNDWPMADCKTNEGANFLLGTKTYKLWRTGTADTPADTPGNLKDFIWANNNNRDLEVRKEYIPNAANAPYDLIFKPANRDVSFQEWFKAYGNGRIDSVAAVNFWATSPINRSHACDGKITTGEMVDQLVFLAHYGKTTLREKWVGGRFIADLPGARPHLTLGYTAFSPIYITEQLRAARARADKAAGKNPHNLPVDRARIAERLKFDDHKLWQNTVYPAGDRENWFVSATAAYWQVLSRLPNDPARAQNALADYFNELNCRFLYTVSREGDLKAIDARRAYDVYGPYDLPRIKGTMLLHQLRLLLGNETFAKLMNTVHDRFANREMRTEDFAGIAKEVSGKDLGAFIAQWLERTGLPDPAFEATKEKNPRGGWDLTVVLHQSGSPWHFLSSVRIETAEKTIYEPVEMKEAKKTIVITLPQEPLSVTFNPDADIAVPRENFYTLGNFFDDFDEALVVYGTGRQIEANRTLAENYSFQLAETFTEILTPLRRDAEISEAELASKDLIVLGGADDNSLVARLVAEGKIPVQCARQMFRWNGMTFDRPEQGLILVLPNPWNKKKTLYLHIANSAYELWRMTRTYRRGIASWALFTGDDLDSSGYHAPARFTVAFKD